MDSVLGRNRWVFRWPSLENRWPGVAIVFCAALVAPVAAAGECVEPLGDLNGDAVTNVVDGNGVWVRYNEDGMESGRCTYKDCEPVNVTEGSYF